ncbi:MAG TPA: DUF488 domain-containing protein [Candidatus Methylomirabilis sp.]|nr:DUF488 domain-containing protein [Candidatus Methylomirabilis sp.]
MTGDCHAVRAVHTVGHSTRSTEAFLALLAAHAIGCVVDVRRWPASRRHPHFGRESLTASLASAGVEYVWREDLGGDRAPGPDSPNTAWRTGAFRAYADFMLTPAFAAAVADLELLAARRRIAVMCAEAVPWRCHRQLLADAFWVRGWPVRHILDTGCAEHRLPAFARVSGERIVYPASGC